MRGSRQFVIVLPALVLAGCGLRSDANVYAVNPVEASKMLNRSDLAVTAFGHSRSSSFATSSGTIVWRSLSRDKIDCEIALAPSGESAVTISVDCGSGPDQTRTLDSITANQTRQDAIEMIDATLTGRAFDRKKKGETAYRWPENKGDLSARKAESGSSGNSGYGPPPIPEDWQEL